MNGGMIAVKLSWTGFTTEHDAKIIVRPQVNLDVEDYVDYLSQYDEDRAFRFFDAVRETFADLARMPGMGKRYRHPTNPELHLHQ